MWLEPYSSNDFSHPDLIGKGGGEKRTWLLLVVLIQCTAYLLLDSILVGMDQGVIIIFR